MQEDIENRTVAISVTATKLTGRVLAAALGAVCKKIKEKHQDRQAPQGRQSVKKLMNHRQATSSIPLDGDTKLFDRVARDFKVDYAFYQTEPGKYMLFFKSSQADAITAAFTRYTKLFMEQAKDKRVPIREQMERAAERVREQPLERERTKEAARDER